MDNENNVEVQSTKGSNKTNNIFFTIFACLMTGVIVFLATNIGQKASKTVDPETNTKKCEETSNIESNVTSNVDSNSNSNIISNVTSNVTSNITSNVTSNTTSNVQNNTTKLNYRGKTFDGAYANKTEGKLFALAAGIYVSEPYNIEGCGTIYGSYIVEENTITFFPIVNVGCSIDQYEYPGSYFEAKIISDNEIQINGKKYTAIQYNSDVHSDFAQHLENDHKDYLSLINKTGKTR